LGPVDVDRIAWHAPAECPDDAAVERRIAELLGATPTASERASADVAGDVTGYDVELVTDIDGARQRRALHADDCAVLADAVAVVVAVALDPVAVAVVEREQDAVPVPDPTLGTSATAADARVVPPASAPVQPTDIAPRVRARAREPWGFGSRVAGGYGVGTAPGGTGLVGVAMFAQRGRAQLEVEGRFWAPRRIEDGDSGGVVLLGTASVAGCLQLGGAIVTAPVCVGLEAGALRARGFGLPAARTVNFPWLAPLARAALAVRVHARVRLWLALEGAVLALRPQLQRGFSDPDTLWQAPPVSARVMMGVEARWSR
jgi:hypothetical protein